jgi:hypothetical protein
MMVAGGAIAAIALLSGGGLARADYPPVPAPQAPEVQPPTRSVAAQAPAAPTAPAQLPSTGSGIDTTLMLAGTTLLAGIGIAGASSLSRRRREHAI